jgi:hypothetical protein
MSPMTMDDFRMAMDEFCTLVCQKPELEAEIMRLQTHAFDRFKKRLADKDADIERLVAALKYIVAFQDTPLRIRVIARTVIIEIEEGQWRRENEA